MIGLGTIINTGAILLGGLLGIFLKKLFNQRLQQTLTSAIGICVMMIGISGVLKEMYAVTNGSGLSGNYILMLILSFVLGSLVGELINIERQVERFGEFLKRVSKSQEEDSFVNGFLTASFTACIGAMAIMGAIKDGLSGDYSILLAKSVLDFVTIMVLTSSMGKGCIFSVIPVFILQGAVTLLAFLIAPLMTTQAISNIDLCGSALIFCVGVNLIWKDKIKVSNMLPTLIFAVIFSYIF